MRFLVDHKLRLLSLDGEAEVLTELHRLQQRWDEIKAAVPAIRSSDDLFTLLIQLQGHLEAAAQPLAALGIDVEKLLSLARKLRSVYDGQVPADLQKLLRPMAEFSEAMHGDEFGEVQWRPLNLATSAQDELADGMLAFAVSGSATAGVEFEAGAVPPDGAHPAASYVRCGLQGDVSAKAGAKLALKFGGLGMDAAGQAGGTLDYWCRVPDDALDNPFLIEAGKAVAGLPSPFSLDDIWKAADERFAALRVTAHAQLDQTVALRFDVKPLMSQALDGTGIGVVGGAIELDARVSRQRLHDTLVTAQSSAGGRRVTMTIRRQRAFDRVSKSTLQIGLDFSEIAQRVRAFIEPHLAAYEALKRRYGKYLEPGTLLREELRQSVADLVDEAFGEKPELERLVAALTGDGAAESELRSHLIEKLVGRAGDAVGGLLDQGVGLLSAEADKVAQRLGERLGPELGARAGALTAAAKEALENVVVKLQTLIGTALEDDVKALVAQGGAQADAILQQARKFAADAGDAVHATGETLDDALAGVRGFLAKVDERLANVTKALGDAARQRLTLRIGQEERLSRGASANLTVHFTANTPVTCAVFERIVRGELEELPDMAAKGIDGVELVSGELEFFVNTHRRRTTEIALFRFAGSEQSLFSSRARVQVDLDGNVVVSSEVKVGQELGNTHEQQQTSFLSPFDLETAKQSRVLRAKVAASQEDSDFSIGELQDFLDGFVALRLVSAATMLAATTQLKSWREASGHKNFRARIDVSLALDDEAIATLLENPQQGDAEAELARDRALVADVLEALSAAGAYKEETIRRAAKAVKRLKHEYRALEGPHDVLLTLQPAVQDRVGRPVSEFMSARFGHTHEQRFVPPLRDSSDRALRQAYAIHLHTKGFAVLLATLREIYQLDPNEENKAALARVIDEKNRLIGFCLTPWLKPSRRFIWIPHDDLREAAHAFFLLLAEQAGLMARAAEGESVLSVVLSVPGEGGETVVF